jgi:hypothetical protein
VQSSQKEQQNPDYSQTTRLVHGFSGSLSRFCAQKSSFLLMEIKDLTSLSPDFCGKAPVEA